MRQTYTYIILCFIIMVTIPQLKAQNLIRNGSFDEVRPYSHGANYSQKRHHFTDNARFWDTPTGGTPDIFIESYRSNPKLDKALGLVKPRTGKSMIGIRLYGCELNGTINCREYIQTEIKETLKSGKCYEYEYYAQPNSRGNTINSVGIGFSENQIDDMGESFILDLEYIFEEDEIINNGPGKWVKISGYFSPNQDYNHVIIGNFSIDEYTMSEFEEIGTYAYYYIDDVSLFEIDCSNKERITQQVTYVINDLNFAHDKFAIEDNAHIKLSDIYDQIKERRFTSITINGYTDDSGTDLYNLNLSKKRADSVLAEFAKLGIPLNKMKAVGHGNTNQIDAVNKAKNRRVEIIVE